MKYIILGVPVAQGRPRFSSWGGTVKVHDPKKSKEYKQYIKNEIKKQMKKNKEIKINEGVPILFVLHVFVPIPKTYTKKIKEEIKKGNYQRVKKPDVSNYLKLVEDACSGVLYHDDNQIVEIQAKKMYDEQPRIELEIMKL